ncbi:hypothetical protein ACWCO3_05940 [Micromonospora sp. NPDC002411]
MSSAPRIERAGWTGNPRSRRWRAALVAQPPVYLLATPAAAANAV